MLVLLFVLGLLNMMLVWGLRGCGFFLGVSEFVFDYRLCVSCRYIVC